MRDGALRSLGRTFDTARDAAIAYAQATKANPDNERPGARQIAAHLGIQIAPAPAQSPVQSGSPNNSPSAELGAPQPLDVGPGHSPSAEPSGAPIPAPVETAVAPVASAV